KKIDKMKGTGLLTHCVLRGSLSFCEKFPILRKGIPNPLHIVWSGGYIGNRLTVLAITLLSFAAAAQKTENTISTVVIDAGHGGKDPGTRGSYSKEKDIALAVALKLGTKIEAGLKDVKVLYTRKT